MRQETERSGISESKYRRHIARARNASNYFTFFRLYYKIMRRLDALFLQDLANLAESPGMKRMEVEGRDCFLCTAEFLSNSDSAWTLEEQRLHFAHLREAGFVWTTRQGMPCLRWVYIDYEALEDRLDEALAQLRPKGRNQLGEKPLNKTGEKDPNLSGGKPRVKNSTPKKEYSKNGNNEKSPYGGDGEKPRPQRDSFSHDDVRTSGAMPSQNGSVPKEDQRRMADSTSHKKCRSEGNPSVPKSQGWLFAEELAAFLEECGVLTKRPNIPDWAKEIDTLLSERRTATQVRTALECFKRHVAEDYCPTLYSATDFCAKFPKLENLQKREQREKQRREDRLHPRLDEKLPDEMVC